MKSLKLKDITIISLLSAIICVVSPFTISLGFSPIPITLANFIIYLISIIFDVKKSVFSVIIYIIIGIIGLPVFSGGGSGFSKILGPTGGYILGYIFISFFTIFFTFKFKIKKYFSYIGMIIGTLFCYFIGTFWLKTVSCITFKKALVIGVYPYIIIDFIKMFLAYVIGFKIKERISFLN